MQLDSFKCVLHLTVCVTLRSHRTPSLCKGSAAIQQTEVNQSLSVDFSGLCEVTLQLHRMLEIVIKGISYQFRMSQGKNCIYSRHPEMIIEHVNDLL